MNRGLLFVALAVLFPVAGLIHSSSAFGQAGLPSAEQLELLQNLTPEQREEILRQITGSDVGSMGSSVSGSRSRTRDADDLDRTRAFYEGLLGLREGPRPPLGFPGAWLYAGERPVLHVIAGRMLPPERRGVLDHMAFSATGLADVAGRLDAAGIAYDLKRQA